MHIGTKVKNLRKSQGMKLIELAKKSGVQIATLSRIEHEKMVGTLESHANIAKALGIDITQLYAGISPEGSKEKVKKPQAVSDIYTHSDKSTSEILTSKIMSKKMVPMLIKIEPGGKTNVEENQAGSEKFAYAMEGKVELTIGSERYTLSKNNSLYFDASQKHQFINTGKSTAKVICVVTPAAL